MKIQDLLNDKTKFPDDLKLNLNGVEVSFGDIRQEYASQQASLDKERKTLQDAQAETAKLFAETLEQKNKAVEPPVVTGKEFDYEADPFLGGLVKKTNQAIAKAEARAEKAEAEAAKTRNELNSAIARSLNREWQQEFNSIQNKPEGLDLKKTLEYATSKRLVDDYGVPDIQRAVRELSEPQRIEAAKKTGYDEGYAKGQEAALLNAHTTSPGFYEITPQDAKSYNSLDEAIAAARKDPEILQGFNRIPVN